MTNTRPTSVRPAEAAEPDKYDRAVAYLTEHPNEIYDAWAWAADYGRPEYDPVRRPGVCLFLYAAESTHAQENRIGCLTMVRRDQRYEAQTPELTEAIRADGRIPSDPEDIRPEHLDVFAHWQRRLDRELNRA